MDIEAENGLILEKTHMTNNYGVTPRKNVTLLHGKKSPQMNTKIPSKPSFNFKFPAKIDDAKLCGSVLSSSDPHETNYGIKTKRRRMFVIWCSYLEIYQEQLYDLLGNAEGNTKINGNGTLNIREDGQRGTYVDGLQEIQIKSISECMNVFLKGETRRHINNTKMNEKSSRSHCIFSITIQSKMTPKPTESVGTLIAKEPVKTSTFNLVDLAGSERQKLTEAAGNKLREAATINTSLSVFANVLKNLSLNSNSLNDKKQFVHFRDSKLTFLLKDALNGNSTIAIVGTVSQNEQFVSESLSTLNFCRRAKSVKTQAKINEKYSDSDLVYLLRRENNQLKKILHERNQGRCATEPIVNVIPIINDQRNNNEVAANTYSGYTPTVETLRESIAKLETALLNQNYTQALEWEELKTENCKLKRQVLDGTSDFTECDVGTNVGTADHALPNRTDTSIGDLLAQLEYAPYDHSDRKSMPQGNISKDPVLASQNLSREQRNILQKRKPTTLRTSLKTKVETKTNSDNIVNMKGATVRKASFCVQPSHYRHWTADTAINTPARVLSKQTHGSPVGIMNKVEPSRTRNGPHGKPNKSVRTTDDTHINKSKPPARRSMQGTEGSLSETHPLGDKMAPQLGTVNRESAMSEENQKLHGEVFHLRQLCQSLRTHLKYKEALENFPNAYQEQKESDQIGPLKATMSYVKQQNKIIQMLEKKIKAEDNRPPDTSETEEVSTTETSESDIFEKTPGETNSVVVESELASNSQDTSISTNSDKSENTGRSVGLSLENGTLSRTRLSSQQLGFDSNENEETYDIDQAPTHLRSATVGHSRLHSLLDIPKRLVKYLHSTTLTKKKTPSTSLSMYQ